MRTARPQKNVQQPRPRKLYPQSDIYDFSNMAIHFTPDEPATSPYYGLRRDSAHIVQYELKNYPTADHLFHAMMFLPHRKDIAEYIRCLDTHANVRKAAKKYASFVRQDWGQDGDVLLAKFIQNCDLRDMLRKTGKSKLIYYCNEELWGNGPSGYGLNMLGNVMMKIRNLQYFSKQ
ncbi:hypothetical protein BDQ17DRAFT_1332823 [Cyathus striatus]|nr:hypothetical protein BDQ17DRAFT_1332823 [Cyathus striatus]